MLSIYPTIEIIKEWLMGISLKRSSITISQTMNGSNGNIAEAKGKEARTPEVTPHTMNNVTILIIKTARKTLKMLILSCSFFAISSTTTRKIMPPANVETKRLIKIESRLEKLEARLEIRSSGKAIIYSICQ